MKKILCIVPLLTFLSAGKIIAQQHIPLSDKIGQMILVGYVNTNTAQQILMEDISDRNLGGILHFGHNISSRQQITQFNATLQENALTPLFLATDQEGGRVARLGASNGFEATHSARRTGIIWSSVDSTRNQARKMASWFHETGLNTNFAPVVDVDVNPDSPAIGRLERSYNSDPAIVTQHALAFIEEFRNRDVITALKHFPGHGSATADSHYDITDITNTWQSYELNPYIDIMMSQQPDMVMSGHLFHRGWDDAYPASLSQNVLHHLLRDSLQFHGVIISDEMFMRAIRDHYTFDDAIVKAIQAGTDILLFNNNQCTNNAPCGTQRSGSLVQYVIDLVERKINEGELSEDRINESYERIMKLKERRNISTDITRPELPIALQLHQNYPNPFNPTTTISWEQPSDEHVHLAVYDIMGREIAVLANSRFPGGSHSIVFRAENLASGVYLYRLSTSRGVVSRTMTLVR